ncbi:site-specific integrase [Gordonia sp. LSe1-13]|uniref:Site-specific integrase n=1 Tax=Gordonia sesuvii TaxID=3116777 RepID=A0ABU7MKB5_9ACTN|nr:site-specific integrase [Gordonia sp. LSe1-13]
MSRREPITRNVSATGVVTYSIRVDVGVDEATGRRVRQRSTHRTLAEARAAYRRISTEVADGRHVVRRRVTVGEFLTSWLDGRRGIRAVTLSGYRSSLSPVIARLGHVELQKLTRRHLDDLVTWRLTEGRASTRPPLSELAATVLECVRAAGPAGVRYGQVKASHGVRGADALRALVDSGHLDRPERGRYVLAAETATARAGVKPYTVVMMLNTLIGALDDAIADGLLDRNVARTVEKPTSTAPTMGHWDRPQLARFAAQVATDRLAACWQLSMLGLRRSELMGVTWSAIDTAAGTLTIRQGRARLGGSGDVLAPPKSARSRRTLALPPDVVAALSALKATQQQERLALGVPWDADGLIVVDEIGDPYRPDRWTEQFQAHAAAAGLPPIRLHDLRHTAATVLLSEGHQVHAVAAWLGHDPAMTLSVYGHALPSATQAAGAALIS